MQKKAKIIEEIERYRAGVLGDSDSQILRLATVSILNGVCIGDLMEENDKIATSILNKEKRKKKRKKSKLC